MPVPHMVMWQAPSRLHSSEDTHSTLTPDGWPCALGRTLTYDCISRQRSSRVFRGLSSYERETRVIEWHSNVSPGGHLGKSFTYNSMSELLSLKISFCAKALTHPYFTLYYLRATSLLIKRSSSSLEVKHFSWLFVFSFSCQWLFGEVSKMDIYQKIKCSNKNPRYVKLPIQPTKSNHCSLKQINFWSLENEFCHAKYLPGLVLLSDSSCCHVACSSSFSCSSCQWKRFLWQFEVQTDVNI